MGIPIPVARQGDEHQRAQSAVRSYRAAFERNTFRVDIHSAS